MKMNQVENFAPRVAERSAKDLNWLQTLGVILNIVSLDDYGITGEEVGMSDDVYQTFKNVDLE